MRKLLSIALLLAVFLPMLAPLLASAQNGDDSLPACCRRSGRHHCAMTMAERSTLGIHDDLRFQLPLSSCPYCPATAVSLHVELWGTPPTAQAVFAAIVSHPCGTPQTECRRRIARDRSRQKRGPPTQLLL